MKRKRKPREFWVALQPENSPEWAKVSYVYTTVDRVRFRIWEKGNVLGEGPAKEIIHVREVLHKAKKK